MDVTARLDTPYPPATVFEWVEDLTTYPRWLDIVSRAEPEAEAHAWSVDLRGRLGPFARTKRLRMVRARHEPPQHVTFERDERDGRRHSPWVLRAEVEAAGDGCRLTMHLHYGGALWGPVLERLLGDEIERSRPRLLALIEGGDRPAPS
ncbi:MAG: SRPBCC family protein [Acidimicrobiales bacterium]